MTGQGFILDEIRFSGRGQRDSVPLRWPIQNET